MNPFSRAAGQLAKLPLLVAAGTVVGTLALLWLESRGVPAALSDLVPPRSPTGLPPAVRAAVLGFGVFGSVGVGRRLLTHLETLAHELGHAAAAVMVGGTPTGLTLRLDGSGEAQWLKPGRWRRLRLLPVAFSGYWAPSAVAVALLEAARRGFGAELLGLLGVCGAVAALLLARCLWSAVVTLATAAGTVLLWHTTGAGPLPDVLSVPALGLVGPGSGALWAGQRPAAAAAAGVLVAAMLAGGAIRSSFTQATLRDLEGSDAYQAAGVLWLPARAVAWFQLAGCVAAALYFVAGVLA